MLLIADSGSTKTDWLLQQSDGSFLLLQSFGLNPFVVLPEDFKYIVRKSLYEYLSDVSAVKFYGAGCTAEMIPVVKQNLADIFLTATIEVHSDLVAAAHATLGNEPGVAVILGTGSNSGYFDGQKIAYNVPSLGYVLGDEGSGNWMGKQILRDFLRGAMPDNVRSKFEEKYDVTLDSVINKVYKQHVPNAFLAYFTSFLHENIDDKYVHDLVQSSFDHFVESCLLNYKNIEKVKIGVVGSIAFVFKDILVDSFKRYYLNNYTINPSPLDGLKSYFTIQ